MNNELMINKIKDLCKNENITVTRLEEMLGFSQGLISRWKDKSPTLDRVVDIADHFHVSLDELTGRIDNFEDKFLAIVYNQTISGSLLWRRITNNENSNIIRPHRDELYSSDYYTEMAYYATYNEGYFIINCFCKHNNTSSPIELDLYIQPTDKDDLVYQNYTLEQLKPLWIAILKSLYDEEAPDDVKAENLKQQIIFYNTITDNELENVTTKIVEKNPNLIEVLETINTPEFQAFKKAFSSPDFIRAVEAAGKVGERLSGNKSK